MREPAVTAPDSKMPAADDNIVGTMEMAVSATGLFKEVPYIVTTDPGECPGPGNIFNAGNKNTRSTAVIAGNFCLVGNCLDYLICNLPAMVTVSAIFCENELLAHKNYWMCPGSLICCTRHQTCKSGSGLSDIQIRNRNIRAQYLCMFLVFCLNGALNNKNTT
jgi:hypothetical protein